jgi:hypothetical protein
MVTPYPDDIRIQRGSVRTRNALEFLWCSAFLQDASRSSHRRRLLGLEKSGRAGNQGGVKLRALLSLFGLWLAAASLHSSALAQASATAASPFGDLSGSWSGTGTVTLSNGTTERLRCQASYQLALGGSNLRQDLRCASDSYNFDLRTRVDHQGGSLSGTWWEVSRNASGQISGQASRGQIQAVVQGPGFSAGLAMGTRGDQQTVTIRSQGTELSQVSISLRRTSPRAMPRP